jgi:hypothetical protein
MATFAVALLAGCESNEQRFRPANLSTGRPLPGRQYLVGGGLNIAWKAPVAGTIFLTEKRTGKLVETRSMDEGDVYTFVVDSTVRAQELGDILGISLARTQFLLYFEPGNREQPTEQARWMEKR